MTTPTLQISDRSHADRFTVRLVEIEISDGITTPEQFAVAVQEMSHELVGAFVVFLTGRAPIWGYGMLIHAAHPSQAIATYDPRLGYVVVQSHDARFAIGQVLDLP
jgi:CRISPR-associated protein Csx3